MEKAGERTNTESFRELKQGYNEGKLEKNEGKHPDLNRDMPRIHQRHLPVTNSDGMNGGLLFERIDDNIGARFLPPENRRAEANLLTPLFVPCVD